jgi:hypothetical protein
MFQNLWLRGLNWDNSLPADLVSQWLKWKREIMEIDTLKYACCIIPKQGEIVNFQLHGFGDASEKGYAAGLYLRTVTRDGHVLVKLVCA